MFENYLIKGLLMGIAFGVPAGAVGILTIKNTLDRGFFAGLVTGLGSSAADMFYAFITVFGISVLSEFLLSWQTPLGIGGSSLIIIMGILNITAKKKAPPSPGYEKAGMGHFIPSFLIALLNPATLLSFFIAFAAFGITGHLSPGEGFKLILGILLGTCFWWIILSGSVSLFRKRITPLLYGILHPILGTLLIVLGAVIMIHSIHTPRA